MRLVGPNHLCEISFSSFERGVLTLDGVMTAMLQIMARRHLLVPVQLKFFSLPFIKSRGVFATTASAASESASGVAVKVTVH